MGGKNTKVNGAVSRKWRENWCKHLLMGSHPLVCPSVNASTMPGHHRLSFGLKEKKTRLDSKTANAVMFTSREERGKRTKENRFLRKKIFLDSIVEYLAKTHQNCCCFCSKTENKLKCLRISSSWNVGLSPPR